MARPFLFGLGHTDYGTAHNFETDRLPARIGAVNGLISRRDLYS